MIKKRLKYLVAFDSSPLTVTISPSDAQYGIACVAVLGKSSVPAYFLTAVSGGRFTHLLFLFYSGRFPATAQTMEADLP